MSDRFSLGLDNPAFRGRLHQPSGLGQSLHVAPKLKAPRPSARYIVDYDRRTVARSVSQQLEISPLATVPVDSAGAIQPQPVSKPVMRPAFSADWQTALAPAPAPILQPQPIPQPAPAPALHKPQDQSHVLKRPSFYKIPEAPQPKRLRQRLKLPRLSSYSRPQLAMFGMGIAIFAIGLMVSFSTLSTNHAATAQVDALAKTTVQQPATTDSSQTGQGSTAAAPSTAQPSAATIANYAVAPTLPRYLDIPRFGVHARVLSLGILNSGALATPNNVFDAGWYNMSAKPGEAGATLLDGHVSSWTTHGVFYSIGKLVAGDQLKITRGDGQVITYEVVKTQSFDKDNVDMQSAVTPVDPTKSGLNLITCTGQVIKGTSEFNQRILVYAKQI